MTIKVLVQVYKDRRVAWNGFKTIGEFSFDDKELNKYKPDEAMYKVLNNKLIELGYNYPLQFWSGEKDNTITACLDDRQWGIDHG